MNIFSTHCYKIFYLYCINTLELKALIKDCVVEHLKEIKMKEYVILNDKKDDDDDAPPIPPKEKLPVVKSKRIPKRSKATLP